MVEGSGRDACAVRRIGSEALSVALATLADDDWTGILEAGNPSDPPDDEPHRLHVVTYASNPDHRGVTNLRRTAEASGLSLHVEPVRVEHWTHAYKTQAQRRWFDRGIARDEDVVLFLDGYDTILLPTSAAEILSAYLRRGVPIVASGCRYQWPYVSNEALRTLYPLGVSSTYGYLCAGAFIGRATELHRMVTAVGRCYDRAPASGFDDQLAMQEYTAAHPDELAVDTGCDLFVSVGRCYDNLRFVRYRHLARVLVFNDSDAPSPTAPFSAPPVLHVENDEEPKWDYDAVVEGFRRHCALGCRLETLSGAGEASPLAGEGGVS